MKVDIQTVATMNAVDDRSPNSMGGGLLPGITLDAGTVRMMSSSLFKKIIHDEDNSKPKSERGSE